MGEPGTHRRPQAEKSSSQGFFLLPEAQIHFTSPPPSKHILSPNTNLLSHQQR